MKKKSDSSRHRLELEKLSLIGLIDKIKNSEEIVN